MQIARFLYQSTWGYICYLINDLYVALLGLMNLIMEQRSFTFTSTLKL